MLSSLVSGVVKTALMGLARDRFPDLVRYGFQLTAEASKKRSSALQLMEWFRSDLWLGDKDF